jgi:hypothetical protein
MNVVSYPTPYTLSYTVGVVTQISSFLVYLISNLADDGWSQRSSSYPSVPVHNSGQLKKTRQPQPWALRKKGWRRWRGDRVVQNFLNDPPVFPVKYDLLSAFLGCEIQRYPQSVLLISLIL